MTLSESMKKSIREDMQNIRELVTKLQTKLDSINVYLNETEELLK